MGRALAKCVQCISQQNSIYGHCGGKGMAHVLKPGGSTSAMCQCKCGRSCGVWSCNKVAKVTFPNAMLTPRTASNTRNPASLSYCKECADIYVSDWEDGQNKKWLAWYAANHMAAVKVAPDYEAAKEAATKREAQKEVRLEKKRLSAIERLKATAKELADGTQ